MEDVTLEKMDLKLGNSYVQDQMKKFSEKHEGKISVTRLTELLMTFPETDDVTTDDLVAFVSKKMDLNHDGMIGVTTREREERKRMMSVCCSLSSSHFLLFVTKIGGR